MDSKTIGHLMKQSQAVCLTSASKHRGEEARENGVRKAKSYEGNKTEVLELIHDLLSIWETIT